MIPLLNGNPLQLPQISTSRPACVVDWTQIESTAEEHGSEPDPSFKQTPIIPAGNSSMDLLASVATGIIEVSPNLRSAAEVMDQFRKKQQQQALLYQQLSELENRRKRAVDFADELGTVADFTARIYQAALGKAYEARASFDRATEVAFEAWAESHQFLLWS